MNVALTRPAAHSSSHLRRAIAAGVVLSLAACAPGQESATSDSSGVGQATSAIVGGSVDNTAGPNNATVALVNGIHLCTGSLIAPNVVLTARHCVSEVSEQVKCTVDGMSPNGPQIVSDYPAAGIQVFIGTNPDYSAPVGQGSQYFYPPSRVVCNADIALLVLARPIPNVPVRAVRMSGGPRVGENLIAVGYGQDDQGVTQVRRRTTMSVLDVGPKVSASATALASNEFEVSESFCAGDSGGPAISAATGAIVGTVSRNLTDCTSPVGNIYTSTAGFNDLFDRAFKVAGGQVTLEAGDSAPSTSQAADASDSSLQQGTFASTGGLLGDSDAGLPERDYNYGLGLPSRCALVAGGALGRHEASGAWASGCAAMALATATALRRRRRRHLR